MNTTFMYFNQDTSALEMTHTSIEQLVLMGSEFFANLTFQLSANGQIGVVSLLMTR